MALRFMSKKPSRRHSRR